MSELAHESFRWQIKQYEAALTAANERIRELERLLDTLNLEPCAKILAAEREVSDKLLAALQIAVSTCFTEYAHHKYMSDPESPIRALLAEVAAIRKGE